MWGLGTRLSKNEESKENPLSVYATATRMQSWQQTLVTITTALVKISLINCILKNPTIQQLAYKPCEGTWLLRLTTHLLGLFLLGASTSVPCLPLSLPVFALLFTLHGSWLLGAWRPGEGKQSGTLRGYSITLWHIQTKECT